MLFLISVPLSRSLCPSRRSLWEMEALGNIIPGYIFKSICWIDRQWGSSWPQGLLGACSLPRPVGFSTTYSVTHAHCLRPAERSTSCFSESICHCAPKPGDPGCLFTCHSCSTESENSLENWKCTLIRKVCNGDTHPQKDATLRTCSL